MFESDDTAKLRRQLDRFAIPMFLAELTPYDGQFELKAINATHERHSGMCMEAVIHRPLNQLLLPDEASAVNGHYTRCIHADGPIRYRETLCLPCGKTIWDTTLSRLTLPDGRERIIGSAVIVQRVKRNDLDTLAFQDVEFFASTSSMRLTQISDLLDAVESGRISADQLAGSAGMLAGLCRSVDETLRELRSIAKDRLVNDDQVLPLIDLDLDALSQNDCEVATAMTALIEVAKTLSANGDFAHASGIACQQGGALKQRLG